MAGVIPQNLNPVQMALKSAGISPDLPLEALGACNGKIALDAICGTWDVRRKVIDYRTHAACIFEGQAVIGAGRFEESGELRTGHTVLRATRSYCLRAAADQVSVLFADGRDFVRLAVTGRQTVHHGCGKDAYTGRLFFRSVDAWAEVWRVRGPEKSYVSLTRYSRAVPNTRSQNRVVTPKLMFSST